MTDKMTVHPLKKMMLDVFSVRWAVATFLSASVLIQAVHAADQEWWFDVEVIIFERNLDAADISEKFKQSRLEQPASDALDLITPYLNPDLTYLRAGLPYCRASNQLAVKTQYQQDFAFPLPVPKINEPSRPQTDIPLEQGQQLEQQQQTDLDLGTETDETAEEKADNAVEQVFQYDVTTTNTFAQPNDTASSTESSDAISVPISNTNSDTDSVNPSYSAKNASADLGPQPDTNLPAEVDLIRPPIKVEFIEWQIPSEFLCAYAEQIDPSFASIKASKNDEPAPQLSDPIERVPEIINGIEWQQKRAAFLLPTSTMYMRDLYEKIKKQRGITPILHINWRQEVKFSRSKGQTFRLFAGENFAQQFDANGSSLIDDTDSLFDKLNQSTDDFYIPEKELARLTAEQQQALSTRIGGEESEGITEDLFARIAAALADDTAVNIDQADEKTTDKTSQQNTIADSVMFKELWQLDGEITVYLRNINRVPYLHIDSNLDYRQPIFDSNKAPKIQGSSTALPDQSAVVLNQLQPRSPQPNSLQPITLQPNSQKLNFLQSVNFNQLRRVISKQVHYFDHPLFGMVVRLNRYRWPEEEEEEEEELELENNEEEVNSTTASSELKN
jgi:hypothetical protein